MSSTIFVGTDALGRIVVVIYSYSGDTIRLMSARKATSRERKQYEKKEYNFTNAKRGRVVSPKGKSRITISLDTDVIEEFRTRADKAGYGYQTMINEALRQYLEKSKKPLDEAIIRQVIREELDRAANH